MPFVQPPRWHAHRRHVGADRQRLVRHPPDLLITTPESLYLMLTSSAADTLAGVETVIVDEIHALAPTKRGAHLALSLERLEEITGRAAAAHRPVGHAAPARGGRPVPRRLVGAGRAAAGHHRRRRHPQAARDRGRHPGRGHGRPRPGDRHRTACAAVRPASADGAAAHQHLAERSTRGSSTRSWPTARRSSSATPAARPSGSPPSSTSWPSERGHRRRSRERAATRSSWSRPTTARWRASSASSSRTS